ncbi:hypothetical protein FB567DRAFT_553573 [Paraphoma chrysanthemicola]|uniref:Uncharacterized protein n=1 Tax=Paraphoma chrysanthemicola TaxID=798071 RepID=A0A8K0QWI4_9PLEO|nr:hypothetical protein FB567DRAFT_553573 [Paraphoma chrysanthemicola]
MRLSYLIFAFISIGSALVMSSPTTTNQHLIVNIESSNTPEQVPGENPAHYTRVRREDQLFAIHELSVSPYPPSVGHRIFFYLGGITSSSHGELPSLEDATLELIVRGDNQTWSAKEKISESKFFTRRGERDNVYGGPFLPGLNELVGDVLLWSWGHEHGTVLLDIEAVAMLPDERLRGDYRYCELGPSFSRNVFHTGLQPSTDAPQLRQQQLDRHDAINSKLYARTVGLVLIEAHNQGLRASRKSHLFLATVLNTASADADSSSHTRQDFRNHLSHLISAAMRFPYFGTLLASLVTALYHSYPSPVQQETISEGEGANQPDRQKVPGSNPAHFTRLKEEDQLANLYEFTVLPYPPIDNARVFFYVGCDIYMNDPRGEITGLANATLEMHARLPDSDDDDDDFYFFKGKLTEWEVFTVRNPETYKYGGPLEFGSNDIVGDFMNVNFDPGHGTEVWDLEAVARLPDDRILFSFGARVQWDYVLGMH